MFEKTKIKEKEAGKGPFLKQLAHLITLKLLLLLLQIYDNLTCDLIAAAQNIFWLECFDKKNSP